MRVDIIVGLVSDNYITTNLIIEYIQTSTQLASSPKCTAQKKREYVKTVVWAAKQITKKYETKLGSGKFEQILLV